MFLSYIKSTALFYVPCSDHDHCLLKVLTDLSPSHIRSNYWNYQKLDKLFLMVLIVQNHNQQWIIGTGTVIINYYY